MFGATSVRTSPGSAGGRGNSDDRVGNGDPEVVAPGKSDRERALWKAAWEKAEEREEDECPICMCSMMPITANNPDAEKDVAQGKGHLGATQDDVGSPSNTEKSAAALLATRRDRTAKAEVVEVEEGQENREEGHGGGVSRGRRQTAPGEGGGTTKATENRRTRGGGRRRRQADVGETRARLLLSCSHVFHKAVSRRVL